MTTNIRVTHRGGNKVVRVYREARSSNGEWYRSDDEFHHQDLKSRGDESSDTAIYDTQRIVIEEVGEFING